jgi:hypothetical protein
MADAHIPIITKQIIVTQRRKGAMTQTFWSFAPLRLCVSHAPEYMQDVMLHAISPIRIW